mmetsp:Transcript_5626/g.11778  ORF Transcript_5626/g.11778 Transcript_5626/m.11778 type:complete len:283 (+) Transcript_5626:384-1232(+)
MKLLPLWAPSRQSPPRQSPRPLRTLTWRGRWRWRTRRIRLRRWRRLPRQTQSPTTGPLSAAPTSPPAPPPPSRSRPSRDRALVRRASSRTRYRAPPPRPQTLLSPRISRHWRRPGSLPSRPGPSAGPPRPPPPPQMRLSRPRRCRCPIFRISNARPPGARARRTTRSPLRFLAPPIRRKLAIRVGAPLTRPSAVRSRRRSRRLLLLPSHRRWGTRVRLQRLRTTESTCRACGWVISTRTRPKPSCTPPSATTVPCSACISSSLSSTYTKTATTTTMRCAPPS